MKNEKLKKCNELKEKEVTSEENFNQKREKYLRDISDSSTTNNSGNGFQNILLIIFFWILISGIVTSNNSNKNDGYCGKYNTFYGSAFSGGWITTFDGITIYIEFPNEYIDKKWSKYDKQNICIRGNVERTPQQGNQPDVYTIYNPHFNGYAD